MTVQPEAQTIAIAYGLNTQRDKEKNQILRQTADSTSVNVTVNADADTYDYCIFCKPHQTTLKAAQNLKEGLQAEGPDLKILMPSIEGRHVENDIRNSRNIILFLTAGFTADEEVISQWSLAQSLKKHTIRVVETLMPYHAPEKFEDLLKDCPDHLKSMVGDEQSCIEMSHGKGKPHVVAQIVKSSVKASKGAIVRKRTSLGGLVHENGVLEIQVFDQSLVRFAALWGVSLPGAGHLTKRWSVAVWIILSICALMCLSRFGTTVGPAFLDYATIIQISVDHPALVLFLLVSFKLVRSSDVEDIVQNRITCTELLKFQKCKQKIATGLSAFLTVSLVLYGWAGYLPGFFHEYYIQNSEGSLVLFGLSHGIIWVVILPIFFGSLFAALLIMFVVQELCYCAVFSTFSKLHPAILQSSLHDVAASGKELKVTRDDFAKFQQSYMIEWERNRQIQKFGAVPFMVFWLLEFCLLAWSIWSLTQGFEADDEDARVPRLESHWNLVVRLTFFMVHSLWFGAGALIVGFLPFGVNFYGLRMRQLCRRLKIPDTNIKADLMTFMQAHDLNFRVWIMRTSPWALPFYAVIVGINIVGFNAEAARVLGAYGQ